MPERPPVASLPMYDWPEVRWAHDALWAAVAERLNAAGMAAPAALERDRPSDDIWRDPGLVLSQTCGYPYATRLREKVQLVGTPVHEVGGCVGPLYSSAVITRRGEASEGLASFARRRIAFNADDSLSGYVALRAAMREAGLDPGVAEWIETGSHRQSVRAVADGDADLAAIDAVCWALAGEFEPDAVARLEAIAETPLRPGLPLITAGRRSDAEVAMLRIALDAALTSRETQEARRALHLTGTAVLDDKEYAAIAALGR